MESSASVPLADRQKLEFAYDFMGRRYSKKVYAYDSQVSDFTLQVSSSFLYDGWNMIHETTTPQSPALPVTRSYVWGLDLSQTLQGAGGVGGLLCSVHSPQSGSAATYYATADANGNITDYVNETGAVSASFTYDAFGQVVSESIAQGLEPNAFPHRFSSKYEDTETGLNYYGYRYYSAGVGRWLNRDPIGERGEINLYGFVRNAATGYFDLYGLLGDYEFSVKRQDGSIREFGLTEAEYDIDYECKCKKGVYYPRFAFKVKLTVTLLDTETRRQRSQWDNNIPKYDEEIIQVFTDSTSRSKRRRAVRRHENKHVSDLKEGYKIVKKVLLKEEKTSYGTDENECEREAAIVISEAVDTMELFHLKSAYDHDQ